MPGVTYRQFRMRGNRWRFTRIPHWASSWLLLNVSRHVRNLSRSLEGFAPEAVLSVTHGYSWLVAAQFAETQKLPLHLILHDEWPPSMPVFRWLRSRQDRLFGRAYRYASSRLCVSPFMEEEYRETYGAAGQVAARRSWPKTDTAFEPPVTELLGRLANAGEAFVDIGANFGYHSLTLLARRPDVPCAYAFEPSREMCDLLAASVTANGFGHRCEVRRLALGGTKGSVTLRTFQGLDPMHASVYPLGDLPYAEELVTVDTLDSLVPGFGARVGLVKCDVEGSERDVLLGAKALLSGAFGPPPIWLLEVNYETAAMAGYFPWHLIEIATQLNAYESFHIRNGRVAKLPDNRALRHGETLILAMPSIHTSQLSRC